MASKYTKERFIERALLVPAHICKGYSYDNFNLCGARNKSYVTCPRHGDFLVSPNNHLRGRGCAKCVIKNSSFPEKVFFYYLSQIFQCVSNLKFEFNNFKYEADIFIPELKLAIEYDGKRFHGSQKSVKKDKIKNSIFKANEITVFRVREVGLPSLNDKEIFCFDIDSYKPNFKGVLENVFNKIKELFYVDFQEPDINLERDEKIIYSILVNGNFLEKSLETVRPDLIKYWHPIKNLPLTPANIRFNSKNKVWWLYDCGHEVEQVVNSVTKGYRCKACFGDEPVEIHQYSMAGYYICSHNSIYSLQKLGFTRANINKCLRGEREYANNFRWSRERVEKLPPLQYKEKIYNLKPNYEDIQFLKWFNQNAIHICFTDYLKYEILTKENAKKLSYPPSLARIIRLEKNGLIEKFEDNKIEYWKPKLNSDLNNKTLS